MAGTTGFYETVSHVAEKVFDTLPRSLKRMTIFEGLAGSEADIDAIFEIEEDFESALDTGEGADDVYQQTQSKRRFSGVSISPPAPPPQPQSSSPPRAIPRLRLNSVVNRGVDATAFSPLAQVFQPLVVDEDPFKATANNAANASGSLFPLGISYGPASRRRLTSIQSMHRGAHEPLQTQLQLNTGKKFPLIGRGSPKDREGPFKRDISLERMPETVTEVKEQEGASGTNNPGEVQWLERLTQIEQRQARIEDLLSQIAKNVGNSK